MAEINIESSTSSPVNSTMEDHSVDMDISSKQCVICLDEIKALQRSTTNCCDHEFCFQCITTWSKVSIQNQKNISRLRF